MAGPAGLLSLPNELLIIIFENPKFPADYLCILAVLCRRLHFLALPIYFALNGMPAPSKSAVVTLHQDGMDMLAALQMALFLTSIEDITCVFPHPSCTSIFPLLPHVRRFRRFISRFPTVKRVTLQLDARNSMCNAAGDDAALRAWSSTFGSLLNSLVDRQCTELTVRYGGYFTRSYTLRSKHVRRTLRVIKRLFHFRKALAGNGWEFRRSPEQGQERALTSLPARSSRSPKLTSLHIQSAVLITPPCLNWTLSALRHCPITSFTLSQVSLEKELWNAVFTLIAKAAPGLAELSLSELEFVSDEELLQFCIRLPRLTELKIGSNESTRGTPTKCQNGPIPEFRALASLTAPSNFILYFLRPRSCFPKLKSLCISFHGQTDIRAIGVKLATVCKAMAARQVSPSLSLSLALYSDNITFDLGAVSRLHADVTKYFSHVSSLELHVFPYEAADIARWIHLFGSIQHVSLTVRSKPADADADARRLFKAISKDKSHLTITINGKRQNADSLPRHETKSLM
ncbi:hypothetical protein B0H10DRAFT_2206884 [Mycena sp. CBHHK59/15]|nr:hypothetical protein B0H10DRAFT_2206884 [Mycena sp. CBHHK59/15]